MSIPPPPALRGNVRAYATGALLGAALVGMPAFLLIAAVGPAAEEFGREVEAASWECSVYVEAESADSV